jgi:hypothetical protein
MLALKIAAFKDNDFLDIIFRVCVCPVWASLKQFKNSLIIYRVQVTCALE